MCVLNIVGVITEIKTCYFLLPLDGAMITDEYETVNVFRAGLLTSV